MENHATGVCWGTFFTGSSIGRSACLAQPAWASSCRVPHIPPFPCAPPTLIFLLLLEESSFPSENLQPMGYICQECSFLLLFTQESPTHLQALTKCHFFRESFHSPPCWLQSWLRDSMAFSLFPSWCWLEIKWYSFVHVYICVCDLLRVCLPPRLVHDGRAMSILFNTVP